MSQPASISISQQRQPWIDIYKGLGILAIVLGHINYFWPPYVYLFHIAAFFFIAGYTVNTKVSFGDFLWKKIKTLLFPFFIFNTGFVFIHYLIERHQVQLLFLPSPNFDLQFLINNILKTHSTEDIGGATWFLIALFTALVAFQAILRSIERYRSANFYLLILIPICLASTYYLNQAGVRLHFMIDMIPMALAFIIPGYLWREIKAEQLISNHLIYLLLWIPLLWVIAWIRNNTWFFVDFAGRQFENPWLIFSNGIIGILLLLSLAKFVERLLPIISKPLQQCGVASLWIMCLHFLGFRLSYLLLYNLGYLPLEQTTKLVPLSSHPQFWIFHTLFAVLFSILCKSTWDSLRSAKMRTGAVMTLLLGIGILNFNWTFSPNHFYFADDFGHLFQWSQKSWGHFLSILPQSMYNDRPLGQAFYKLLADCFGTNYRTQHFIIFLIHVFNGWLFYLVTQKITGVSKTSSSFVAILTATLFMIWPQTNIPAQWISAAFDLLGATLILTYLLVYFSEFTTRFKFIRSLLLVIIVVLMARTKESTLLVPFATMLLDIYLQHQNSTRIPWRQCLPIIKASLIPITIAFSYIGYLIFLKSQFDMGFQQLNHPYYSSLSPINIFTNYFKYLYLFFHPEATGQTFKSFELVGLGWTILGIVLLVLPIALLGKGLQRLSGALYLFLFFLILLPVLPLANMQHELYLYMPSIWIFLGLALILRQLLNRYPDFSSPLRFICSACLALLLYYNTFSINMSSQISWYLGLGAENTPVFKALQNAKIPEQIKTINIFNINFPNSILQFSSGKAALTLAQGKEDPELTVNLSSEENSRKLLDHQTLNLNYQKLRQGVFKGRYKK